MKRVAVILNSPFYLVHTTNSGLTRWINTFDMSFFLGLCFWECNPFQPMGEVESKREDHSLKSSHQNNPSYIGTNVLY